MDCEWFCELSLTFITSARNKPAQLAELTCSKGMETINFRIPFGVRALHHVEFKHLGAIVEHIIKRRLAYVINVRQTRANRRSLMNLDALSFWPAACADLYASWSSVVFRTDQIVFCHNSIAHLSPVYTQASPTEHSYLYSHLKSQSQMESQLKP